MDTDMSVAMADYCNVCWELVEECTCEDLDEYEALWREMEHGQY